MSSTASTPCSLNPAQLMARSSVSTFSTLHPLPVFGTVAPFAIFASLAMEVAGASDSLSAQSIMSGGDCHFPELLSLPSASALSSSTAPASPMTSAAPSSPSFSSSIASTLQLVDLDMQEEESCAVSHEEEEAEQLEAHAAPPSAPSPPPPRARKSCAAAEQRLARRKEHRTRGRSRMKAELPSAAATPPPTTFPCQQQHVNADAAESCFPFEPAIHSVYTRGLICSSEALARLPRPMPAHHPIHNSEDIPLLLSPSLPLLEHVFSHPATPSAFHRLGTAVVAVPPELTASFDPYLLRIPQWLQRGMLSAERPTLNCNEGVPPTDQWMAFYRTPGMGKAVRGGMRQYTLWATAAEYKWSTLLVQNSFSRQQTRFDTAVEAGEEVKRLMKGFECGTVERINRLMMILHCDGQVEWKAGEDEEEQEDERAEEDEEDDDGVRVIRPMLYFEHLFLFPTPEDLGWSDGDIASVDPARFLSWSRFANPHFHFPPSSSSSSCPDSPAWSSECRGILFPCLPGITSPMVYVSAGYSVFPWHKEDLSLRSSFCVLDGAPKLLFTVPARHERAFSKHMRKLSPPSAHPLFHRSKSMIVVPGADWLERFDIGVRLCSAGQVVVIESNVWHCGINMGVNSSISVNIVGAGGVEELRKDLHTIVNDLRDMQETLRGFKAAQDAQMRDAEEEDDGKDDEEGTAEQARWKKRWNTAVKLFAGQVHIYNSQQWPHLIRCAAVVMLLLLPVSSFAWLACAVVVTAVAVQASATRTSSAC